MNKPLRIPAETLRQQFASSDPGVTAWVSANAGSGKTHVLTQRVIRLMLAGNAADRILCLTFTKAAAANMKNRIFDTLAQWVMLEDAALDEAIENLSGQAPSSKQRREARTLFAKALDTPGGLKIQTIHAFCESLLHQFPLEANVPGHFETLQELGQADLLAQAKADVLSGRSTDASVLDHYAALNAAVSADAIEKGISEIIAKRNRFSRWSEDGIDQALGQQSRLFGLKDGDDETSIIEAGIFEIEMRLPDLVKLAEVASGSEKPTDQKQAEKLRVFLNSKDTVERYNALVASTLTAQGDLRSEKVILTKYVKDRCPNAVELLGSCGEVVLDTRQKLNSLSLIENSHHLFNIGEAVLERYGSLKRARGVIDFDDQVEKCANLLTRSEIREWIRYRLDRGIDHMLVDEAQDTSPRQWQVINAITDDFHSGHSAAMRERTVFVVGDEKQSIYSFQGAEPEEFAKQERSLKKAVEAVQKPYHPGSLSLSFRSTADVLHAVDRVFSIDENRTGLLQSGEQPVHDAIRSNDPGEVFVWPLYARETAAEPEDWLTPIDQESRSDPAVQLAERITDAVQDWVGKPLPGSPEPLKFGDILVLVRKRDRFIPALTRTMKDAGLQVAGADRITLTEHIAVEDLLAIGQFVLLPVDDLNLACVLKSVLFDVSEEELFTLAHKRPGKLIDEIMTVSEDEAHALHGTTRRIRERLEKLQQMARSLDVFEFFAWVLGPFGGRKAFLARLGMEAEDVLDAFLDEALGFTREGGIGLENFISGLRRANPEIKREVELDRDEVRILTVHASKGLEAKVVFLVDPCNAPWSEKHRPKIMQVGADDDPGLIWLPSKEFHNNHTRESTEEIKRAAEGEYRRLLYVGMTRAADRLVVCGYRPKRPPGFRHWHAMVSEALAEDGTEVFNDQGELTELVRRSGINASQQDQDETKQLSTSGRHETAMTLPDWATTSARHEPPLPSPLSPAGAHALIDNEFIEPPTSPVAFEPVKSFALERGIALHKLLEKLPDIDIAEREVLAMSYLERYGAEWGEEQRLSVWKSASYILESAEFKDFFVSSSRAEVPVSGKLQTRSGARMITGKIDRLVVTADRVLILDYKTGGFIPRRVEETPAAYVTQLALYREILREIYPQKTIDCAILWTGKPEIMLVPDSLLTDALVKIKNI